MSILAAIIPHRLTKRYYGSWHDWTSCANCWSDTYSGPLPANFPGDHQILYASYGGGSYEGDALVIYESGGMLYENHGSHCSCYGLEGQWTPEATSWAALKLRPRDYYLNDHDEEARKAFWELVDSRI